MVALGLFDLNPDQVDGLGGRRLAFFVHPRAVLAQVGHFALEGIDAAFLGGAPKRRLVHARRAGGDDHAIELLVDNRVLEHGLPGIRAHVLVVDGMDDAGHVQGRLGDRGNVYGAGDVLAAVANEDANA